MVYVPPKGEPRELFVGSTWEWDKVLSETLPSEGYTLRYDLIGPDDVTTILAATSSEGDYFEVRELSATHAGLTPGTYVLIGYVEDATPERPPPIYYREVYVRPNPAESPQPNTLTQDEAELAKVNAALLTLADFPEQISQVYSRRTEFKDPDQLRKTQGVLRQRVAHARRGGEFRKRKVSFGPIT